MKAKLAFHHTTDVALVERKGCVLERLDHGTGGKKSEVTVLRRAPLADPVIFRVAGCEFALRRAQARSIRVRDSA